MIDLWQVRPGDVIHRCNVSVMDQDVPLFVLACRHDPLKQDKFGVCLSLLGLYMVADATPYLREVDIDAIEAHEYNLILRPVQTSTQRV